MIPLFFSQAAHASPLPQNPAFAVPAAANAAGTKQNDNSRDFSAQPGSGYWKDYITDTEKIVKAPSGWDLPAWAKAVGILGATAALYFSDQAIQQEFQEDRSSARNRISGLVQPFGNVVYLAPSLGAVYFYGDSNGNSKMKNTALLSLESLLISNTFTGALKLATQRARPFTGLGPNVWYGPGLSLNNDNLSFPSDHTTSAFAIASVVSSEYGGKNLYVSPLAYGLASIVGFSRLNDNQHWASDVFLGSAIGYFTAKAIVRFHPNIENSLIVLPSMSDGSTGFVLMRRF